MSMLRSYIIIAMVLLALVGGCAKVPPTGVTPLKATTIDNLQGYLLGHKAELEQFRLRGPFAVTVKDNIEVQLSATEHIKADLFLSAPDGKAPLVIFLHGYASSKEDHTFQAMHVASWGMHSLALQLPNTRQWTSNGRILARIVSHIHHSPATIDSRIDVSKIILVGHSFGGTSVAIALSESALAAGGILLDPAAIGRDLPKFLRQIKLPVMLLGADEHVSSARNRDYFFRYIPRGIAEVSIKDASHEDAQYPSATALTTEEFQITFASAITSAAFSLATTGNLDYAWASFGNDFANGKLFKANRK